VSELYLKFLLDAPVLYIEPHEGVFVAKPVLREIPRGTVSDLGLRENAVPSACAGFSWRKNIYSVFPLDRTVHQTFGEVSCRYTTTGV